MDKVEQLRTYTVQELVGELKRRKDELDTALSLFVTTGAQVRNPRKSEAKAAYWREWHEYHAAHPNATVGDWRKAKKRKR